MSGSAFWMFVAAVIIFVLSVIQVLIDWGESSRRKRILRSCLIVFGALGVVVAFVLARQTSRELKQSDGSIQSLTQAVTSQKQQNETDYQRSQQQLQQLGEQLQDLRSQVMTQELRKKITKLQSQLTAALAPKPLAKLIAGFYVQGAQPIDETSAVVSANLSLTLHVSAYNPTDIVAQNGSVLVQICRGCTYTKEPEGFVKVPGDEKERQFNFQHIYAMGGLQMLTFEVTIPAAAALQGFFQIGIAAACDTCAPTGEFKELKINLVMSEK